MSSLSIFNSLTRKKEIFKSIEPNKVSIYTCGITVYDDCHLGHARALISFDVFRRYLKHLNYEVKFVRNITDIDDKIIKRAQDAKESIQVLTTRYIDSMHADMKALNILPPDKEPRATDYIHEIIKLIETLIENGLAYQTNNGDVCFKVESFKGYGKLSHKDIDGLLSGARIDISGDKHSPLDFVLWKKAKPSEPQWESPFGPGRPGWHIECSAMALKELGDTFDIHGGGLDLQFPHHENEIAQSEGATKQSFAHYWMHVGMLQVDNEKMSKSLNNFFTIKSVLEKHKPEVIRYFLISSHYRSPINYSEENISNAKKGLKRLYQTLESVSFSKDTARIIDSWVEQFNHALNDDMNTPGALAVLFNLSREVNKTQSIDLAYTLQFLGNILGLLQENPSQFLKSMPVHIEIKEIERLIDERRQARIDKNWAHADVIRNKLDSMGIQLEDTSEGTKWHQVDS